MTQQPRIEIFVDGICEPRNPGGYACWAYEAYDGNGNCIGRDYGTVGHGEGMTNNIAEYHALLNGLQRASRESWLDCIIKSDSQLVVNQVNGTWNCNQINLAFLKGSAAKLAAELRAKIIWIPREQNTRADHLSNVAYNKARQGVLA